MWSREPDRYRGVPKAQADRIRRRDKHTCQKCGRPGHDVDHIINVADGGTDEDDNLQVLCPDCHRVKTQTEATLGKRRGRYLTTEAHPGLLP
jgi:5-methylcytosine-specific restriction protein A